MRSNSNIWRKTLAFLGDVKDLEGGWFAPKVIETTQKIVEESLDDDLAGLQKDALFIFSAPDGLDSQTEQNEELLKRWHFLGNGPSLTALCILATENMHLELSEEYSKALLLASILGETVHNNPYHNNFHFKKVLLQVMRMSVVHNEIYVRTKKALSDEDVALLLIAACIHDLGHDGKGNTIKGVIRPGHLEKQSFDIARPYFEAVGFNNSEALEYLRIMLLGTDTAPLDDPVSYMNQMKAAYRYHYLGEDAKTHALNLDSEIACLQRDKKLSMMSLILHEADIATSAGISYEVTKYETSIFMQELKGEEAYPHQIVDFLKQICQRKFLSDAGQRLYAANFARIYTLAKEDVKNGNHAFPKPEHSDFMITYGGDRSGAPKTLN